LKNYKSNLRFEELLGNIIFEFAKMQMDDVLGELFRKAVSKIDVASVLSQLPVVMR